jgi:hypothetical protein
VTRSTTIHCPPLRPRLARLGAIVPVVLLAILTACGTDNGVGPVGPPAGLQVVAGDDQLGTVGAPVPQPPSVRVRDADGRGVAGVSVRFDVISGGGSVTGDSVVTDSEGLATVGEWRLGPLPVENVLRAQTIDHPYQVTIEATAGVGAPSSLQIVSGGANLSAVVGQEVIPRPTVRVRDAFGNPVPGATVTWVVTEGGGSIIGPNTSVTDAEGRATVTGWRLGPVSGINRLQARTANGLVATFTANGIGVPDALIPESPTSQTGFINFAVPRTARVRVSDALGGNIAGLPVVFKITSGTGKIIGDTVITDIDGIAALGDWKMGVTGFSEVTATVAGFTGPSAVFTATGTPRAFVIDVRFLSVPPADLRDAYIAGAMRWMEVIVGDLPDVQFNAPTSFDCFGSGFVIPPMTEVIDDVVIYARIGVIDGVDNVIARATACFNTSSERPTSKLTIIGGMEFDVADATKLLNDGRFTAVVVHEMGHVLGLDRDRFQDLGVGVGLGGTDPYFTGNAALAAWPSLGLSYSGNLIPLHNANGSGSADHHWRESVLGNELMTPFVEDPGVYMPLSAITVGAMSDLGYLVNPASADPFLPSLGARQSVSEGFLLNEEIYPTRWRLTAGGRPVPIN